MTDMTEDQILARAREIGAARYKARQAALEVERGRKQEHLKLKLKQDIEMIIPTERGEISEDQLARVLDAVAEYKDDLEYL